MKTQTANKKYSMMMFSALASLMLITAACQKNSGGGNNNAPPPVVVTPGCTVQPCTGIPGGGVQLYGGTTTNSSSFQIQFQVSGDQSGNGMGYITGNVRANFLCNINQPISGDYTLQGQGNLTSDVFSGNVMLTSVSGQMPINAYVETIPTRTQGSGMFRLYLQCVTGLVMMNF